MTEHSESRLLAMGRAAPLDSLAAAIGAMLAGAALSNPGLLEGLTPEQATAICTGIGSLGALIRAWIRGRRRRRRAARKAKR